MNKNSVAADNAAQNGAKVKRLPSAEYLHECFSYDPETGHLTWKERPREHFKSDGSANRFQRLFSGRKAGHEDRNSFGARASIAITMKVGGRCRYFHAHNIIWSMLGRILPEGHEVDHKDGNPWNNKLENLRLSTPSQNCYNRNPRPGKKNGLPKGIRMSKNRFEARITFQRKTFQIGSFRTLEAAESAYKEAAQRLHGEFAFHISRERNTSQDQSA